MQPPSDPLDALLHHWGTTTPPAPGHLETEVWRRIAVTDVTVSRIGIFARVEAMFARPSFSVAFVTACMLLGLFLAEARVSQGQTKRNIQVVQNYLRLVDPLLEAGAGYPGGSARSSHP